MNVDKIRLINFRNFKDASFNFHSSLNIFIGDNAQGKTNVIESIYTLLRGNSYRAKEDSNLINWSEKESYILGEVSKNKEKFQINILLQDIDRINSLPKKAKKIIKVNKKYRQKSWLTKRFTPVIFTPEDLQIIKSSPSVRRKFLDEVIINLNPIYERYLRDYSRVLFQRNMLLKSIESKSNLEQHLTVWDQKIVEIGSMIIRYRVKTLQIMNQKVKIIHQLMTKNQEVLKLKYNSNILTSFSEDNEEIGNIFEQKLSQAKEQDLRLKVTTVGPHRDDYFIMNNLVDLGIYGSQGQQRTAVLALKMAELELLKEKDREYPPLLLDDVLSELDSERRLFLMKIIKERPLQTFITSIDIEDLTQYNINSSSKIFRIKDGTMQNDGE
ncbi:MAG: DNA replication/repair protein RecF [Candidatus Atribacteria bacterium]|nr:DNA replication/repair protein RecF [Candidatus Atribacteria bacterium]